LSEFDPDGKSGFQWSAQQTGQAERAIVLVPELSRYDAGQGSRTPILDQPAHHGKATPRTIESRLAEACGLAEAISLNVVESGIITLKTIKPNALFGSGKIEEIAGIIRAEEIGLAIVDHPLTPVQQRNLEKAWNCKVLDRTGLILEIFGARARTKEGRLQVELAHLNYLKGRLVRQWTHLERQRGGLGKTGGPGETQIEADRRLLQDRIVRLEKELEKVRRTRNLHRRTRKKVPTPVVALVGYTNAGKSTLFNRLTEARVVAKDMLFATLDPTLRKLQLPQGSTVILSDTVGFISNLPTTLIAAFRATLEEVIEADLIIHVRDISDPDHNNQAADVYNVLEQLDIGATERGRIIEVWNKIDLIDPQSREALTATRKEPGSPILASAATGEGTAELLAEIENRIGDADRLMDIHLGVDELNELSWVYENANVLTRLDRNDGSIDMRVRVQPGTQAAFRRYAA
jgi:GTPase